MKPVKFFSALGVITTLCLSSVFASYAQADQVAKEAFGAVKRPSIGQPVSIGFYSKGCLSGGVSLPIDGDTWQVMRLSRNRNWGHPATITMLKQLSQSAAQQGWNGLLVGDISQPRGGPMANGHASHQVGLDADIWLTQMPNYRLTPQQREDLPQLSVLKKDSLYVDPKKWSQAHTNLIRLTASNPQVERLFVHPGIKKQLCDTVKGDRSWLGKVRPYWGHYAHFHVRLKCQAGSPDCTKQATIGKGDGCDKSLAWWFTDEPWAKAPPKKTDKAPPKPRPVMVSNLPKACASVLQAPAQ